MIHEVAPRERRGARILVVDDHADTVESLAMLLTIHGHDVQTARGGSEAIATALRWRPEFVLLDLGLPDIDGYQVAARIRQEASCQGTVLIAVTGYGRSEDHQRSHEAGMDYHLLKPVEPDVLLALLSRSEAKSP
jgi:two-component system CheB/CheR fusion protein